MFEIVVDRGLALEQVPERVLHVVDKFSPDECELILR
jgi:hypothetical protein